MFATNYSDNFLYIAFKCLKNKVQVLILNRKINSPLPLLFSFYIFT